MRCYIGYTGTDDVMDGFTNHDIIETAFGATLNIQMTSDVVHPSIINEGLMIATPGSTLNLVGPGSFGVPMGFVHNSGALLAWCGKLSIMAELQQEGSGVVQAFNGGEIDLYGRTIGGSVQLMNATLAFKQQGRTAGPGGPFSAGQFGATLTLSGSRDLIDFGRSDISVSFDAARNDLLVSVPWTAHPQTQIADLHLSGHYSAGDFSVSGNDVVYAHH